MTDNEKRRPAGNGTALRNRLATCTQDTLTSRQYAGRCLACHRPITSALSVARGYGPQCFTREAVRQRHARAEALHTRLCDLLRRLPDLDAAELAALGDALDAAGVATR